MRAAIYLFDIDGTLVSTGGAGRRAMRAAFDRRWPGRAAEALTFGFGGMTDRAIVRAGAIALGTEPTEALIDEVLVSYVGCLEDELRQVSSHDGELDDGPGGRFVVHPGVLAAVDRARSSDASAVGLGTGNVREGARLKLSRGGLHDRFAFGGFGCDAEDRAELLRIGAARGAARLGRALADCRVVVIGDTPRDVDAAHAIGAECVAVATGTFTAEQLRPHAPAVVCSSLLDPDALRFLFPA